jgi:hypothetical protein
LLGFRKLPNKVMLPPEITSRLHFIEGMASPAITRMRQVGITGRTTGDATVQYNSLLNRTLVKAFNKTMRRHIFWISLAASDLAGVTRGAAKALQCLGDNCGLTLRLLAIDDDWQEVGTGFGVQEWSIPLAD